MQKFLPILLIAVFATFLPVNPSAANFQPSIKCLQIQLNDLGIDVGVASGFWHRKLENAANQYLTNYPSKQLPYPSRLNAIVWCRGLGQIHPKLRKFWPSHNNPLQLSLLNNLSKSQSKTIRKEARRAFKFINSELGFDLAEPVKIVASNSLQDMLPVVRAEAGSVYTDAQIQADLKKHCHPSRSVSGAAFEHIIAICLGKELSSGRAFTKDQLISLRHTLAHEISHEVLNQLSGYLHTQLPGEEFVKRGPRWLLEAMAMVIDNHYAIPSNSLDRNLAWYRMKNSIDSQELKRSESANIFSGDVHYYGAGLAGHLLFKRSGLDSFRTYGEALGIEGNSLIAFKRAFGLSLTDFYIYFGKQIKP